MREFYSFGNTQCLLASSEDVERYAGRSSLTLADMLLLWCQRENWRVNDRQTDAEFILRVKRQ